MLLVAWTMPGFSRLSLEASCMAGLRQGLPLAVMQAVARDDLLLCTTPLRGNRSTSAGTGVAACLTP